jgi:hypothetical protein
LVQIVCTFHPSVGNTFICSQNPLDNMSGHRPQCKLMPPVETTTVRKPKELLVQSVHFDHLDNDGTVTTNSVLDLATRPYPSTSFSPDMDTTESSTGGLFDSLGVSDFSPAIETTEVWNDGSFDYFNMHNPSLDIPPSHTLASLTDANTLNTVTFQNETSTDVVGGFFDIDPEDTVTNIHTGEKTAPKRPHQVCCIPSLHRCLLSIPSEKRFTQRVHQTPVRI